MRENKNKQTNKQKTNLAKTQFQNSIVLHNSVALSRPLRPIKATLSQGAVNVHSTLYSITRSPNCSRDSLIRLCRTELWEGYTQRPPFIPCATTVWQPCMPTSQCSRWHVSSWYTLLGLLPGRSIRPTGSIAVYRSVT